MIGLLPGSLIDMFKTGAIKTSSALYPGVTMSSSGWPYAFPKIPSLTPGTDQEVIEIDQGANEVTETEESSTGFDFASLFPLIMMMMMMGGMMK